jgi:hypothetical protein
VAASDTEHQNIGNDSKMVQPRITPVLELHSPRKRGRKTGRERERERERERGGRGVPPGCRFVPVRLFASARDKGAARAKRVETSLRLHLSRAFLHPFCTPGASRGYEESPEPREGEEPTRNGLPFARDEWPVLHYRSDRKLKNASSRREREVARAIGIVPPLLYSFPPCPARDAFSSFSAGNGSDP